VRGKYVLSPSAKRAASAESLNKYINSAGTLDNITF
jgi:hypothetical protein